MKSMTGGLLVLSWALIVGCVASAPPGVGTWSVEMNTPLGMLPATLTLNEDGSGSMTSDQLPEASFSGAVFDGNDIAFSVEVDAQGQTLLLDFSGTVEGNSVSGQFGSNFGDFSVTGSRVE